MSRLSELAVSKRSVTLLLAAALFIAGISAWGSLKQELLPDIEFPVITVIAPYPGAGSADVADQVAVPIERAISGVPRLKTVQSTSANSIALVIAQFEYGTDVKEALASIEEGIADAGLPGTVEPPDVRPRNGPTARRSASSATATARSNARQIAARIASERSRAASSNGSASCAGARSGAPKSVVLLPSSRSTTAKAAGSSGGTKSIAVREKILA